MTWSEIYSYTASLFYHSPFAIRLAALFKLDIWTAEEVCSSVSVASAGDLTMQYVKGQVIFAGHLTP